MRKKLKLTPFVTLEAPGGDIQCPHFLSFVSTVKDDVISIIAGCISLLISRKSQVPISTKLILGMKYFSLQDDTFNHEARVIFLVDIMCLFLHILSLVRPSSSSLRFQS